MLKATSLVLLNLNAHLTGRCYFQERLLLNFIFHTQHSNKVNHLPFFNEDDLSQGVRLVELVDIKNFFPLAMESS